MIYLEFIIVFLLQALAYFSPGLEVLYMKKEKIIQATLVRTLAHLGWLISLFIGFSVLAGGNPYILFSFGIGMLVGDYFCSYFIEEVKRRFE